MSIAKKKKKSMIVWLFNVESAHVGCVVEPNLHFLLYVAQSTI